MLINNILTTCWEYYTNNNCRIKIKSGVSKERNKYTEYNYELQEFDEKGNEKAVKFNGFKELRKEAFLRVFHSDKKGVTDWEEGRMTSFCESKRKVTREIIYL
ncbi:YxeA family protein [Bacillus sp. FSL K6-0040]|uniref:YxeA family protein n=1 Tax=unclassified Bacillus (in: firmicutes) TaxID=185979 RepID=UPI00178C6B83